MDEISAYERLARMIERELELVSQSRFRELLQAVERRSNFHATLPVPHWWSSRRAAVANASDSRSRSSAP
jgi:poly(A) polymerase Pap1